MCANLDLQCLLEEPLERAQAELVQLVELVTVVQLGEVADHEVQTGGGLEGETFNHLLH